MGRPTERARIFKRLTTGRVYLSQNNRGPGSARNLGLSSAQGKYAAFLDSDDLWFPWTLDIYARIIRQFEEPAFIAGKPKCFTGIDELGSVRREPLRTTHFADYYISGKEWRWWGASSFVIRRDCLHAVGGFTSKSINCEDADLAMRLGESKGFVQVSAPFTFGYREQSASAMNSLPRTIEGIWHQIVEERNGRYPGNRQRAGERRRILTRHVRPVTLDCLRAGLRSDAWRLYRATFAWHLCLGRWKYLRRFSD